MDLLWKLQLKAINWGLTSIVLDLFTDLLHEVRLKTEGGGLKSTTLRSLLNCRNNKLNEEILRRSDPASILLLLRGVTILYGSVVGDERGEAQHDSPVPEAAAVA
nr:hypothetical protein Iba_chr03dCG2770 [Ipomoea batatas]GME20671.1 hypothetical protein Iba_scaffold25792CG0010 [Ipomoea batatas]